MNEEIHSKDGDMNKTYRAVNKEGAQSNNT